MKKIILTKVKFALVDNKDYDWLSQWTWCFHPAGIGYAKRRSRKSEDREGYILMHRELCQTTGYVDHIDGNGLNNQRNNLRACSLMESARNRCQHKNNTSGFKGVSWSKQSGKWHSQICVNYKTVHLGFFEDIRDAAESYRLASAKYHKEFSRK